MARRNEDLKLPYCYADNFDDLIPIINYHLILWRIKTFTVFNDQLVAKLKNGNPPCIFKKDIKRNYIISTNFKSEIMGTDFEIQDGDADCSFT